MWPNSTRLLTVRIIALLASTSWPCRSRSGRRSRSRRWLSLSTHLWEWIRPRNPLPLILIRDSWPTPKLITAATRQRELKIVLISYWIALEIVVRASRRYEDTRRPTTTSFSSKEVVQGLRNNHKATTFLFRTLIRKPPSAKSNRRTHPTFLTIPREVRRDHSVSKLWTRS